MKKLILSLALLLTIVFTVSMVTTVTAHPPIFHKRHLRIYHPEIQLIVVDEDAIDDGKLLEILKKAKKGTVIFIKGSGKTAKNVDCPECQAYQEHIHSIEHDPIHRVHTRWCECQHCEIEKKK